MKSASWGAIPFNENLFSYLIRNMLLFYLKNIHRDVSCLIFTCWCIINKQRRITRNNCCCHWKKFTATNGLIVTAIDALDQYSCGGSFPMVVAGVSKKWCEQYQRALMTGILHTHSFRWDEICICFCLLHEIFLYQDVNLFIMNPGRVGASFSKWNPFFCLFRLYCLFPHFASPFAFVSTATGFINITITIKCSGDRKYKWIRSIFENLKKVSLQSQSYQDDVFTFMECFVVEFIFCVCQIDYDDLIHGVSSNPIIILKRILLIFSQLPKWNSLQLSAYYRSGEKWNFQLPQNLYEN